jgi:hypothetical protein
MMFLFRIIPRSIFLRYGLIISFFLLTSPSWALQFGINKVRYKTAHNWKIYNTEHFEVFYYPECKIMAKRASEYAEKAFVKTSKLFDYVPRNKIPLFIYGTSPEFQETNITSQFLPEGVGGFTEVFKNRIVVPMTGSYHELEKVICHELTHAFQYDLIYGEGWRSVNLFKAVLVPSWMMEGMAEWNAQHWESQGEMVLRDALLNDQVMPLNMLDSFDHFEQVYMAYKESQSILEYISQIYGPEKISQLMKRMAANQPPNTSVRGVLGISLDELFENWHFYLKTQAWSRVTGMVKPERYGEVIEKGVAKACVSPDGKNVIFMKPGELSIWDSVTKKKEHLLSRYFQTQGSGVAWSPDGKFLAFSFLQNGEYHLFTMEIKSKKLNEIKLSQIPIAYSPEWSKDGKYIYFSGFDFTFTDIYRYELSSKHLDRITQDQDNESWEVCSSDGKSLYYLCESNGEVFVKNISLDSQGLTQSVPQTVGKNFGYISSLRLGRDGLYITTDRNNRIFNLYHLDFNGENLVQLTNTFTDILSIAPAPDDSIFYSSIYQKTEQTLFAFSRDRLENTQKPPLNLKYLSNSFETAKNIFAGKVEMNKREETEKPISAENKSADVENGKPIPSRLPQKVTHLEIVQATNIIVLKWPIVPEEPVEQYRIYRSTSPEGPFTSIGTTADAKSGNFTDYELEADAVYYYYVTATNNLGESNPSPIAKAVPSQKITAEDYHFRLSPDVLLFLAGYDSSFGFVGGGLAQVSDFMGDHRFGIIGDTIPSVRTGVEATYEFSKWRTTVDFDFYYYQNFFRILDLQTGNVVNEYRNNENGMDLNFKYPFDRTTRLEYGIGTQRFQGSPLYLQFSEGISNYSQNYDQWNVANFYRISFVQDMRKSIRLWPSSGYGLNFTVLHALPIFDSNVSFANFLFETQVFADFSFLNHMIWANRLIGMTSQGPNPQTFFIGQDAPFQAFFTTIRGYGNNVSYGSNIALLNTELRYPIATAIDFPLQPLSFILIKDIELAGFMDVGLASNRLEELPSSNLLSSIGMGLRFYTFLYQRALVMLRFDLAWRLDRFDSPTFYFNLAPVF